MSGLHKMDGQRIAVVTSDGRLLIQGTRMDNLPDSTPLVQTMELKIRPSQVALAALTLSAVFGAAGALVVILVWVNLASLILLFGAEFIRVYSMRFGSRAQPKTYAEALKREAKAAQGMRAKVPTTTIPRNNTGAWA